MDMVGGRSVDGQRRAKKGLAILGSTRPDTSDYWRQCTQASRRRSTGLIGARVNFYHLPIRPDMFDNITWLGGCTTFQCRRMNIFLDRRKPGLVFLSSVSSCPFGITSSIYFMKVGIRAQSDPQMDHVGLLPGKAETALQSYTGGAVTTRTVHHFGIRSLIALEAMRPSRMSEYESLSSYTNACIPVMALPNIRPAG